MKKIEAIIRSRYEEEVKQALVELGIGGMTVTDVKGFGRQMGHTEIYRGSEYSIEFVYKTKIEVVVDDDMLDKAIDAIIRAANDKKIGAGKIFISQVDVVVRVRTGERDSDALT